MQRDFEILENISRRNRRSKYGVQRPYQRWDQLNRRLQNKATRSLERRTIKKADKAVIIELIRRLTNNYLIINK